MSTRMLRKLHFGIISLWMLALLTISSPATATAVYDIDTCNGNLGFSVDEGQYTQKVVNCLESTIIESIDYILTPLSAYMFPVLAVMMVFATIVFGARILSGERGLTQKAVGFLLRLGLVLMFSYELGGFSYVAYDVVHDMICAISFTGGTCYSPWGQIDGFVGRIMGFGTTISVVSGLLGIIGSSLNTTIGSVLFTIGIMALLDILFFVIRIVFVYMTSIVVIGFLIVISPIVIPLAIFYTTEIYFKRWLDTLLSAVLTPILLFAFLQIFLGVFDTVINDKILSMFSCDNASVNCDFSAYTQMNQPIFSWMLPADSNFMQVIEAKTKATDVNQSSVQTYINPLARRAADLGITMPAVNFGPADITVKQQLIYGLVLLLIFTTLMKSMISNIPDVANNIAGAVSGVQMMESSFEPVVRDTIDRAKNEFASGGGR